MSGILIEIDWSTVPTAANIGNDPIEFNIQNLLAGGAQGPAGPETANVDGGQANSVYGGTYPLDGGTATSTFS